MRSARSVGDGRRRAGIAVALSLISVMLVAARWQWWPPGSEVIDLGDASVAASHFYDIEVSGAERFRWSRNISAVTLPALGATQVISVTLNAGRPDLVGSDNAVPFRMLVGQDVIGEFTALSGWHTYSATHQVGLSPDIRLILESETFFPGPGDKRRLGLAVSHFGTEIAAGPVNWPPLLWMLIAVLAPAWGTMWSHGNPSRLAYAVSTFGVLAPVLISISLPASSALPVAAWASLACGVLMFLRHVYIWSISNAGPPHRLAHLTLPRLELPLLTMFLSVLTITMTWPVLPRMAVALPGWPADNFAFLYKLWWFREASLELHQWPFYDPGSYSPFGFDLAQGEATLLNTIPAILVGGLFGDVAAYNLLAWSSFVIAGLGAYLLVREVSGSRSAALLGAVAFAFCAYRMSHYAGHLQLLGTGWIAFAFYFAERTVKTGQMRYGLLMGLSMALASLSAWYYAYMVGVTLALYTLVRALSVRHANSMRRLFLPLLASVAIFLVTVAPVAVPSLHLWGTGGLTHSAKAADEHSAAPLDYLIPNPLHPVWGEASMRTHSDQNIIESSLYLGYVPLFIAIASWLWGRRAGAVHLSALSLAWIGLMLVAFTLSLGLTLHDQHGQFRLALDGGTTPITLPGQLFYDWVPLYSSMRAYARFGVLVELAALVLMGMAWAFFWRQEQRRLSRYVPVATMAVLLVLLADLWTAPLAWGTSAVQPTQTARYLAGLPPGSVMQMPLASSQSGPALFSRTYHGKPLAYGYDTFEPPQWAAARPALEQFPDQSAFQLLRSWDVRYVVVSATAYGPQWAPTLDYLKTLPHWRFLAVFREQRVWDVDPGVLDARPDLSELTVPESFAVFELAR